MNWIITFQIVSLLVLLEGFAIAFCAVPGFLCKDPLEAIFSIIFSGIITILCGTAGLIVSSRKSRENPGLREGFASVGLTWIFCTLFGALPYMCCAGLYFPDALFEAASGITTTGATVLTKDLPLMGGKKLTNGIESLSHALLFWRSLSQWIGGGGIVVFSLAIIPFLGTGSQALYNAEVPGVKNNHDQFTPRVATTAKIMFGVYLTLTVILALLLYLGNMNLFDAVCHALTTLATGGFSTKNASIAFYNSIYIEAVITLFMFLAGCNFILLFRLVKGMNFREYFSEEHKVFTLIVAITSIIIATALVLQKNPATAAELIKLIPGALRQSIFQVVSLISTTGFATADFMLWPVCTHMIILFLMFSGACAGSTAGGFKVVRLLIAAKSIFAELKRCIYPRSVQLIKLDRKKVEEEAWRNTIGFTFIYAGVLFAVALILPFISNMSPLTALSASITAISNVGPGLAELGPSGSFAFIGTPAKLLLSLEMIAGRLELYTILILFMPSFWKR